MAALTITASQVQQTDSTRLMSGRVGVAVTPGQVMCYEEESRLWILASATGPLAQARAQTIALATAAIGGSIVMAYDGLLVVGLGAAPAKGTTYILGTIAGSIVPDADGATTWKKTVIGIGDGAGGILLFISPSDIIIP